jgi:hypothetical protein
MHQPSRECLLPSDAVRRGFLDGIIEHLAKAKGAKNAMDVDNSRYESDGSTHTSKSDRKPQHAATEASASRHASPIAQVKDEELTLSVPLDLPSLLKRLDQSIRAINTPQAEVKDEEALMTDRLRKAEMLAIFVRSTFLAPDVVADERGEIVGG